MIASRSTPEELALLTRRRRVQAHFSVNPSANQTKDVLLLSIGQRHPALKAVPLPYAVTTACRRRMLRDETRMPAHRRLSTIVGRLRGREARRDELARVRHDR